VKKAHVTPNDSEFKPAFKTLYNKYYVDEIYNALFVKPLYWLSDLFYKIFDIKIVDGFVNSIGQSVKVGGSTLRLLQTGNIGFYIFAMVVGIILMLALNLL
jgi:NADH-quinone oxidoreductase subunit L